MKKIILSVLAAGVVATAANAQLIIGPELGLNMANLTMKPSSSTSMKAGLAVGASVDLGITDNIYFQPGLFYLMTGAKMTMSGTDVNVNVNTIQIPLNFDYKFGEPGGNRFFVGIGPYLAYNLGGTIKGGGNSTTLKIGSTKPDAMGNGGDDIKALDLGAGVNLGYQLSNGLFFRAHYQFGFSNLQPGGDGNNSMKSSAFGVTVGYYLGAKKTKKAGGKK